LNNISIIVEADSQSGPYKAVPAPKPLANPPPYRQPPPPANSSSPVLAAARPHLHHNDPSVVASAAVSAAASTAATSKSNPESAGHGLLAHSSKFPVRLFFMLTTNSPITHQLSFLSCLSRRRLIKLNKLTNITTTTTKKGKSESYIYFFFIVEQFDFYKFCIYFNSVPLLYLKLS
jgi:hypothetical protein